MATNSHATLYPPCPSEHGPSRGIRACGKVEAERLGLIKSKTLTAQDAVQSPSEEVLQRHRPPCNLLPLALRGLCRQVGRIATMRAAISSLSSFCRVSPSTSLESEAMPPLRPIKLRAQWTSHRPLHVRVRLARQVTR